MMKTITVLRLFLILQVVALSKAKQHRTKPHPVAVVRHPVQVIVDADYDQSSVYKVTLDGSLSQKAASYEWSFFDGPHTVAIVSPSLATTNVTIPRALGTYKFQLRVIKGSEDDQTSCTVLVQDFDDVGMYHLAKGTVSKLVKMQYEYLMISQQFTRADKYYPKVAEYFRKLSTERASMLQTVMDYIKAKQATIELTSSHPADHVTTMMDKGLRDFIPLEGSTDTMTSSFRAALELESILANQLSLVSQRAEKNHDYDLSQFAAADLIPQVTEVMHEQSSYLETILEPVENDPQRTLLEFLFDRHLKL